MRSRRTLASAAALASALLATAVGAPAGAIAPGPTPQSVPVAAEWLTTLNDYRAMAGLGPVTADPAGSAAARDHSCWMVINDDIEHYELPGTPGYTDAGSVAATKSNVAVTSRPDETERAFVERWMRGPFHAIGILRHNLAASSFGSCSRAGGGWQSGATLDVISHVVARPRPTTPILWPGDGTTTALASATPETPDALAPCGYALPAGLPMIAMMPAAVGAASGTISGAGGALEVCVTTSASYGGVASSIMSGDNAVLVIPRAPLAPGSYTAEVCTSAGNVRWSVTMDPAAATGSTPTVVPSRPRVVGSCARAPRLPSMPALVGPARRW